MGEEALRMMNASQWADIGREAMFGAPAQEEKEIMPQDLKQENIRLRIHVEQLMESISALTQAVENSGAREVGLLRERWDRAFFAALPVTTAHYLPANRLQAAIIDAADLANETIRRHAGMMAARDAVIAEVVG